MYPRRALVAGFALASLVAAAPAAPAAAGHARPTYYVSLGDSYSVGYQPGRGATPGYTAYVATRTHLVLVNFGCAGATTTSIIDNIGCPDVLRHTAGAVRYPRTTQAAAAEAFIRSHRGHIGLITVSIGGNDVTACAAETSPIPCVAAAVAGITKNVTALARELRSAAGPGVPVVGTTYPDVILGSYVYPPGTPTASRLNLADLSVVAFKSLINPALVKAYGTVHGSLVDVTAATGAYTPLTDTTTLAPYGTIPVAVARVCTLTWFCTEGNIHATDAGYEVIGRLLVQHYGILHHR